MKSNSFLETCPMTEFKSNTTGVLDKARRAGRPLMLTQRGRFVAVVEDPKIYEARLKRLELVEKVARGIRAAESGDLVDHEEAMRRLGALVGE